jgi:hypothetical protein
VLFLRIISGRLLIGLAVLAAGVLLLLNNLGIGIDIEIRHIIRLWPVILLILGINWLILSFGSTGSEAGRRVYFSWGQFITALIFIAFGTVFLGRNLGLFEVDLSIIFNIFWPVILILVGFSLLRGRSQGSSMGNRLVIMGGTKVGGEQPWKLESGSYFALMGSIEIDLTAAEIEVGETLLDLTAIMGGIEVKIPADLAVIYDGSAILGGVSFKDQEDGGFIGGRRVEQNITSGADKIVRIQARAIMGGVEIK